jgi:hypothetical protein
MTFTKEHFIAIGNILKTTKHNLRSKDYIILVRKFNDFLKKQNTLYDQKRFIAFCCGV